jgi:hypothetical protein
MDRVFGLDPGGVIGVPHTRGDGPLTGGVPAELWNRLGTKIVPKLRSYDDLRIEVDISAPVPADASQALVADLRQALADLGISDQIRVEHG